jgi:membrane-associated phospholipid phosphatase
MSSEKKKVIPLWAIRLMAFTILYVVLGGMYMFINQNNVGKPAAFLETFFDDIMPFNRYWVWPYYIYYILIGLPFLIIDNRRDLIKAVYAYIITGVITLSFYAFWPTRIFRPHVPGSDISARLVRALYDTDKPYNCFPSQHVANSFTSAFIMLKSNRKIGLFFLAFAILISLSTVFIKQHTFVDIPSGFLVALISIILVYNIGLFTKEKLQNKKCRKSI